MVFSGDPRETTSRSTGVEGAVTRFDMPRIAGSTSVRVPAGGYRPETGQSGFAHRSARARYATDSRRPPRRLLSDRNAGPGVSFARFDRRDHRSSAVANRSPQDSPRGKTERRLPESVLQLLTEPRNWPAARSRQPDAHVTNSENRRSAAASRALTESQVKDGICPGAEELRHVEAQRSRTAFITGSPASRLESVTDRLTGAVHARGRLVSRDRACHSETPAGGSAQRCGWSAGNMSAGGGGGGENVMKNERCGSLTAAGTRV